MKSTNMKSTVALGLSPTSGVRDAMKSGMG
jgi:hypothetical protein